MRRLATCHPEVKYRGRGLCANCHERARRHGTLLDHARTTRPQADFVEDYVMLRGQGYDRNQIAARLGVTRSAVDKAYAVARRADALDADMP